MNDMRRVYVGHLPTTVQDHHLREAFSEVGDVISAKVIKDRDTGQSRGFGFVEMRSELEAKRAIEELDRGELNGQVIRVLPARPREQGSAPVTRRSA